MVTGVSEIYAPNNTCRDEIDTPRVIETSRDDIRSKHNIGRQYLDC